MKFLNKFYNKVDVPWVHLIWDSYYYQRVPHDTALCGSFWWRDICKLMDKFKVVSSYLWEEGTLCYSGLILGKLITHAYHSKTDSPDFFPSACKRISLLWKCCRPVSFRACSPCHYPNWPIWSLINCLEL